MNKFWQQLAIATNWPVLVAVTVLSAVGVLSIWADKQIDAYRQLAFIAVGLVCMALFQAVNYQRIGRYAWAFYILSLALIFYTTLPFAPRSGFGGVPVRNGAHAWIDFKFMTFQPAELMKIAFVLVMAHYLRYRSNYRTFTGLLPPFLLAIVPLALIMKQPDLGTALVFIPALFAMLFVAGAKISHLLAIVGLGFLAVPLLWVSGPAEQGAPGLPVFKHFPTFVKKYQRERVYALFSADDPALEQRENYQMHKATVALGSGGVTGKGPGNIPIGKTVPEGHNDLIFALIGEQFGFVGTSIVIIAYVVLFTAGLEIASATREPFGRLVAPGIVAILSGQTFINLLVALRLMPVTGITLPFISAGGSSLLASFMAAGLLLNIGQNRPVVMAREAFEFDERAV